MAKTFIPILFNTDLSFEEILRQHKAGITTEAKYKQQLLKYGNCSIDVPIKPIPVLLVTEVLNPFYVF
jgi:hypothetical protein